MKSLTKILWAITLIAVSLTVSADNETPTLDGPVKSTLLKKEKSNTEGPRTLGDLFVTCYYNNECIEVEFPADVDSMDITISDGAVTIWSGFVTADAPACDIPYLVGQYQITCTTDNGAVYQGILSL